MSIEENHILRFIASLALLKKQIRQDYCSIIPVQKSFARPGTVFRGALLSEFGRGRVDEMKQKNAIHG